VSGRVEYSVSKTFAGSRPSGLRTSRSLRDGGDPCRRVASLWSRARVAAGCMVKSAIKRSLQGTCGSVGPGPPHRPGPSPATTRAAARVAISLHTSGSIPNGGMDLSTRPPKDLTSPRAPASQGTRTRRSAPTNSSPMADSTSSLSSSCSSQPASSPSLWARGHVTEERFDERSALFSDHEHRARSQRNGTSYRARPDASPPCTHPVDSGPPRPARRTAARRHRPPRPAHSRSIAAWKGVSTAKHGR
jgi:hypothetical protein